jgi:hypothetical protein
MGYCFPTLVYMRQFLIANWAQSLGRVVDRYLYCCLLGLSWNLWISKTLALRDMYHVDTHC